MNKIILSVIVTLFATSAFAFTANPVPFPTKKPVDTTVTKPAAKPSTKVWLPPLEIQNKVAPTKK